MRHVAFEAQRHSLRQAIAHILDSPLRVLARGKRMKKLMARIFCRVAQVTGTSYARVISYEPGQRGEAIIHNPFDKEMMASIILSAFEALEGVPFEHSWSKQGADDVILVRPALHRSDIAERMEYAQLDLKSSKRQVQTCRELRHALGHGPSEVALEAWRRHGRAPRHRASSSSMPLPPR